MDSDQGSSDSVIKVARPGTFLRDAAVSYTILVDGQDRGTVAAGEVLEVTVPTGQHKVQARVQSSRSRAVQVTTTATGPVSLSVRPKGRTFLFWKAFSGEDWLDLQVTP